MRSNDLYDPGLHLFLDDEEVQDHPGSGPPYWHTNSEVPHLEEFRRRPKLLIVAEFQGVTTDVEETTLGRGGSNLTAAALAYALPTL